jgi:hypothetical protein
MVNADLDTINFGLKGLNTRNMALFLYFLLLTTNSSLVSCETIAASLYDQLMCSSSIDHHDAQSMETFKLERHDGTQSGDVCRLGSNGFFCPFTCKRYHAKPYCVAESEAGKKGLLFTSGAPCRAPRPPANWESSYRSNKNIIDIAYCITGLERSFPSSLVHESIKRNVMNAFQKALVGEVPPLAANVIGDLYVYIKIEGTNSTPVLEAANRIGAKSVTVIKNSKARDKALLEKEVLNLICPIRADSSKVIAHS